MVIMSKAWTVLSLQETPDDDDTQDDDVTGHVDYNSTVSLAACA
jgi:hypothetical protein